MKKKEMLKIGLQIAASIISALLTALGLGVVSCR